LVWRRLRRDLFGLAVEQPADLENWRLSFLARVLGGNPDLVAELRAPLDRGFHAGRCRDIEGDILGLTLVLGQFLGHGREDEAHVLRGLDRNELPRGKLGFARGWRLDYRNICIVRHVVVLSERAGAPHLTHALFIHWVRKVRRPVPVRYRSSTPVADSAS